MAAPTTTDAVYLCEECAAPNHPWYLGAIARHNICALCGGMAVSLYSGQAMDPWDPDGYRFPPPTSCVTVAPYMPVVWDVNGYYRDLGVSPYATRSEVRRAFLERDGHTSPRLTYVVKQLLDPGIRVRYDACQPGEVFFDRYLEEVFHRRVQDEMVRNRALGDALTSWETVDVSASRNKPIEVVDKARRGGQTDNPHGWRNYLWRIPFRKYDRQILREWQTLILEAAAEQGAKFRFAVGLAGGSMAQSWRVEVLDGYLPVAFIGDHTNPTREMAVLAVGEIVSRTPH